MRARGPGEQPLLIAITGYGQPEDVHEAKSAGFDHYLIKPVDSEKPLSLFGSAVRQATLISRAGPLRPVGWALGDQAARAGVRWPSSTCRIWAKTFGVPATRLPVFR